MSKIVVQVNRQVDWQSRHKLCHFFAAIVLTLVVAPLQKLEAVVQDPVQESASSTQMDANAIDDTAAEAITNGISTLKSVRQSLENNEQFDLGPPSGQAETQKYSPDLMELLSSELENARQVEELRDRIRKLIEFDRQRILQTMNDNPETATDSITPAASNTESNPTENQPAIATVPTVDDENGVDEAGSSPEIASAIDTKKILSHPPDQLALANSLFYSGELELAYDLYRRTRASSSDKIESVWIDYQIACCLRRLDNTGGASKILREIAESAGTEPVGENARWWLDQINQKKLIEEELKTFDQFIKRKENEDVNNQGLPRTNP